MTLTLHWWMAPITMVALAFYLGMRPRCLFIDRSTPLYIMLLLACAVSFTAAYWIGRLA